jgi:Cu-processing system permease protein
MMTRAYALRTIAVIAAKELREGLRNRWAVSATVILAAVALTLVLLGSAPTGLVRVSPLSVTVVSLSSLTIFLVLLMALLLFYDAISGEIERGTMTLLLSYPVSHVQIIVGKFLGHAAILTIATVVGYGAAAAALAFGANPGEANAWSAFAFMVGSSVLLGMAFTALGYLVSAIARDPRTAAGIAIGLWLFFAVIFDLALLGLLIADGGKHVTASFLNVALLANPADVYRQLNLTGFSNVSVFAGMSGVAGELNVGTSVLLSVLIGWAALPLALATLAFVRREL